VRDAPKQTGYPFQSLCLSLFSSFNHAKTCNLVSMTEIVMEDIVPISDFVRNASEHAARIRETNRAEILTQHGRPSLAVLPAEEYERLMASKDYLESVEAIRLGLQAAEDGQVRAAEEVIADWETL